MKKVILSMATLLSTAAVFALAPAQSWQISNGYNVRFVGGGDVGGIFKTLKGNVAFDAGNPGASSFDLSIDVASINTGNGLMNTHAKGADWFDAGKYPVIHFVSKKITKSGNSYQVTGDMEMHGVKKEMTLPFSFTDKGATGAFAAHFIINRSDFHIGKPGGEVNENITLDVSVPVAKK